jgi:hypothetical protein
LPNNFLRSYGFIEGGIGLGGSNEGFVMDMIFGGGGGIDLFYNKNGAIYLEAGYIQHYVNNERVGGISISIGIRGYMNGKE